MTINPALTTLLFLFRSLGRPRRNRRAKSSKSFHSFHEVSTLIVCKAMRMHGHLSQIDKHCPPEWITVHPPTHTRSNILFSPVFHPRRVTATSTRTSYGYFNHHVMSLSDHQWPILCCQ